MIGKNKYLIVNLSESKILNILEYRSYIKILISYYNILHIFNYFQSPNRYY